MVWKYRSTRSKWYCPTSSTIAEILKLNNSNTTPIAVVPVLLLILVRFAFFRLPFRIPGYQSPSQSETQGLDAFHCFGFRLLQKRSV
eukprot:2563704-Rhodomonas_salina.4